MEPWHKVATPRKEVREGRSFNPDEFAIALEQVVSKTAPEDYRDPQQFFSRTCFTRALCDHLGMVLRRLCGKTENTAPVLTLITQFGGGKTHTLTALYHIARNGEKSADFPDVWQVFKQGGISFLPTSKVAVFVGNAWDPQEGRETPWIDIARQLADDKGVSLLGNSAKTVPPGTEAIGKIFEAANAPVLILFDEVLNFLNRHRTMADPFFAFLQNLTVATTAPIKAAAVISLPRSQVEMTDWDLEWQDRITKIVRRVAKDLIANDESEISEVVRRRLFEDIGSVRIRKNIARNYADWCFERRAQLPPEWTAVDTTTKEARAREYLMSRFEACYPFHPATLSVFQRKWSALTQYQQTRGTLAMLAQWISWAYKDGFTHARKEPLITLGSAPLEVSEFRSVVLGQLGESRLLSAIDADIAGDFSHAHALDADTKGPLRNIHRRVGTTIFFESSGGQVERIAHLPELRFALGEPDLDTTSIDTAAFALEDKSYFIRKVGTDGYSIGHRPTLKKVVNDRRASLDEDKEIKPAMRNLVQKEFERGSTVPLIYFPPDGTAIPDSPKLTLVLMDPDLEWSGEDRLRSQISEWTQQRGKSPRLYPGSLVWCLKKPGRDFREKVEVWLAWKRVVKESVDGTLGNDFDRGEKDEILSKVLEAEEAAKDEVWGGYRYAILFNNQETGGLKIIDLGAGHSSSNETLCGRIITTLKTQALLNESIGSGYIERNWPPALKETSAWPLSSLRQCFLNGTLTRLLDPDTILRNKIVEFVTHGDFGLASGQNQDNTYSRIWYKEPMTPDEVSFESDVFLILKGKAKILKHENKTEPTPDTITEPDVKPESETKTEPLPIPEKSNKTLRITGTIPPEIWNRFGTKILPKIRTGENLKINIDLTVTFQPDFAQNTETELKQILEDLSLSEKVCIK